MKILIIGSGGREHALAWRVASSAQVSQVYAAPGNAGTALESGIENINIAAGDIDALLAFAREHSVDLTIVGPEDPLAAGIVDRFSDAGLRCFGPRAAAAQLEASKGFAKDFMARHGIPTAAFGSFSELDDALAFIRQHGAPIVVKADGLAAGKGVVVAHSLEQAEEAVQDMLGANAFGEAGHRVVIEEFLPGEEASFIVMADGEHILPLASSQDHKAALDGDLGPNTGGMGAYSPAPVLTAELHKRAMAEIILPTIQGMASEGNPFTGFLYAGLMVAPDGTLKVLEFNVRFGDPETQPVLMRLRSDLSQLCIAAIDGKLDQCTAEWDERAALGVVLAADGYPGQYGKGFEIQGLDEVNSEQVKVFHAGTTLQDGQVVTAGGRVLCVTALGSNVTQAQSAAYAACEQIHFEGVQKRGDIGWRAVEREQR